MVISPDSEDHNWLKKTRVKNEIIWYGERGVINSLIIALTNRNQMRNLLYLIQWADDENRKDILSTIMKSKTIIEVGLNDFGNPDLIIVTEDLDGELRFFFIEAKVSSYQQSSANNSYGMISGYNSTINGQLSLKYRFVKALESWDGKTLQITEIEELHQAYKKSINDDSHNPRKLKQNTIIRDIMIPNGFKKATIENSYFIALTNEELDYSPFNDEENRDCFPVFLDEQGNNLWSNMRGHVGFINLKHVKKLNLGTEFDASTSLMESAVKETTPCGYKQLRTVNLTQIDKESIELCRVLGDYIVSHKPGLFFEQRTGSFSILDVTGIVVGKIVPRQDGEVWFGVRETSELIDGGLEGRDKWCILDKPFQFYKITTQDVRSEPQKIVVLLK